MKWPKSLQVLIKCKSWGYFMNSWLKYNIDSTIRRNDIVTSRKILIYSFVCIAGSAKLLFIISKCDKATVFRRSYDKKFCHIFTSAHTDKGIDQLSSTIGNLCFPEHKSAVARYLSCLFHWQIFCQIFFLLFTVLFDTQ